MVSSTDQYALKDPEYNNYIEKVATPRDNEPIEFESDDDDEIYYSKLNKRKGIYAELK